MDFDSLIRAAESELGFSVESLGDNQFALYDSDGKPILAIPSDKLRVESILKFFLAWHSNEYR